ncbi:MAG: hypothetical protein IIC29_01855 [Chloroflexi bacterium]|nr:hypothetical protein [Chloroflexota bacterium]MCH8817890.1 hypothetical protein [Chloroflexota bacterium]
MPGSVRQARVYRRPMGTSLDGKCSLIAARRDLVTRDAEVCGSAVPLLEETPNAHQDAFKRKHTVSTGRHNVKQAVP